MYSIKVLNDILARNLSMLSDFKGQAKAKLLYVDKIIMYNGSILYSYEKVQIYYVESIRSLNPSIRA